VRILTVFPGMVGDLPPAVTAAVLLKRAGAEVTMAAAGCESATGEVLERAGVACRVFGARRYPRGLAGKALLRLRFRAVLRSAARFAHPDVVWYHTAHAQEYRPWIRSLAPRAAEVAHAHELYEPESRLHGVQARAIREATCWVVPHEVRRSVLSEGSAPRGTSWVVPNRPLETLAGRPASEGDGRSWFLAHGGSPSCSRLVIYQGWVAEDRCILEAVRGFRMCTRADVGLAILGECRQRAFERQVRRAMAGDSRIIRVGKIPPPAHLRITAGCDVGLMLYAPTGLNNLLCAPNKLYEYAWCGLGVVMPAFPHLQAVSREHGFGRACDPTDSEAIAAAIAAELDRDPVERRRAAASFLDSSPSPPQTYAEIHAFLERFASDRNSAT
jgi:hypothetical protein